MGRAISSLHPETIRFVFSPPRLHCFLLLGLGVVKTFPIVDVVGIGPFPIPIPILKIFSSFDRSPNESACDLLIMVGFFLIVDPAPHFLSAPAHSKTSIENLLHGSTSLIIIPPSIGLASVILWLASAHPHRELLRRP